MNRRIVAVWISLVLVLSLLFIIVEIASVVRAPTTWYVDDVPGSGGPGDPPENYTSIQDAINAASDGDTVFVYNGTYYENVIVNKTINLTGENRNTTIIDGNSLDDVVYVSADWVNITGFTLNNSGTASFPAIDSGIELNQVEGCSVIHNKLLDNTYGIALYYSSSNDIEDNIVLDNTDGIYLTNSIDNRITGNTISNIDNGIRLSYSDNNDFVDNIALNNNFAIQLWNSDSNNFIDNNASLSDSDGFFLWRSVYNFINNNTISSNSRYGIFPRESNYNEIIHNNFSNNNNYVIYLEDSSYNDIYHNNFHYTTKQGYDNRNNNYWDNDYPSGGNYWSNYGGVDDYKGSNQDIPGSDSIGDIPHVIDADSRDNYPFMEPYKPLENHIILRHGWNLVSIPLIQEEKDLTRVVGSIDGRYDAVQWYDNMDFNDPWKHHKMGKPFGNDLFELNENMSFWINITRPGDTIFIYNGTVPTVNQTIQLYEGWNMVGYPSLTSYNRTEGLNHLTFGVDVDAIQWFDSATKTWHFMGPDDSFVPGRGYWIHSTVEATWEVPL